MKKASIYEVPIGSLCKISNTVVEVLDNKSGRNHYFLVSQLKVENRYHVIPIAREPGNKVRCLALGFTGDADGTCLISSTEDVDVVAEAKLTRS